MLLVVLDRSPRIRAQSGKISVITGMVLNEVGLVAAGHTMNGIIRMAISRCTIVMESISALWTQSLARCINLQKEESSNVMSISTQHCCAEMSDAISAGEAATLY